MEPEPGEPTVVFCVDEFGPLNLQPRLGRQWAGAGGKKMDPGRGPRQRLWATYTPTYSSWLNRIEPQFTALCYFAFDGTDHRNHRAQASMIRRYIIWRNHHIQDQCLRQVVDRMNVA